uniref:Uncharacterized protein n=1 Tax=Oryza brachyantha TaxID=4533 RepID=J3MCN9_ORYBR
MAPGIAIAEAHGGGLSNSVHGAPCWPASMTKLQSTNRKVPENPLYVLIHHSHHVHGTTSNSVQWTSVGAPFNENKQEKVVVVECRGPDAARLQNIEHLHG